MKVPGSNARALGKESGLLLKHGKQRKLWLSGHSLYMETKAENFKTGVSWA